MERLENLKRKSVLENLGDGFGKIGMHDLWREFARLESKVGKLGSRRWIFEWDEYNAHGDAIVTMGGGLVNVRRMFFLDKGLMKLADVDFVCFPNVTVLKLHPNCANVQVLDLRGLKRLKSLELESCLNWEFEKSEILISVVGLGSMSQLVFLRWLNISSKSSCIDEISCLTNLRVLDLFGCGRAPNLKNLILLEVVRFRMNVSMATIPGLSLNHTNLKFLDLSSCTTLKSCQVVGELVSLQELRLSWCSKLKVVPNLQKLKRLQKLHVKGCELLRALPGLGNLVNLLELHACFCSSLVELPDMHNLVNLRILDLQFCTPIKSLSGLDELESLKFLKTSGCWNLTQLPSMYKLMNLQTLELEPHASLQSFTRWNDLILLRSLHVGIDEQHDGLNLCNLTKLEGLHISGWQSQGISSLKELVLLEYAVIDNCKGVRVLPDLKRLSRLRNLELQKCEFEDVSSLCNLPSLKMLSIKNCNKLEALPNLQELVRMEYMKIKDCALLRDLCGILGLQNLKSLSMSGNPWLHENLKPSLHQLTGLHDLHVSDCANLQWLATCSQLRFLDCSGCPIEELPDVANFPKLSRLRMRNCVKLVNLACSVPLCPNFWMLDISGCKRLQTLPDLANSQRMVKLDVANSGVVLSTKLIRDMKARWPDMDLVTNKTSSWMPSQGSFCGIWH